MFASEDMTTTPASTYPAAKYIRIQTLTSLIDVTSLMLYDYRQSEFVPYNPVEGNIANSAWLAHKLANIDIAYGYWRCW